MQHFFVNSNSIFDDTISISGADFNHIANVLRMKKDEEVVIVIDNGDSFICKLDNILDNKAVFKIACKAPDMELPVKITLYQGLPKGDKFETIIQKAVELGAYKIVPVSMNRSIVKIDEKKVASKVKRWNEISKSAAKQAGRNFIPEVSEPITYKDALSLAADSRIIIPYESANGMTALKDELNNARSYNEISIFIGPEGGFDPSEIKLASEYDVSLVSMGRRILRTETAAIAMLSVLMMTIEIANEE